MTPSRRRTRSRSSSPTCAASSRPAASRGCCTPSAARDTCCVRSRIPIRWKVAILSAGLTFAILCGFAVGVGELTQRRIRDDFQRQTSATADQLGSRVILSYNPDNGKSSLNIDQKFFRLFQGGEKAAVRVVLQSGRQITGTRWPLSSSHGIPKTGPSVSGGYRIETRPIRVIPYGA